MAKIGGSGDVGSFAAIMGCKEVEFPFKYLGLSLGAKYKDQLSWNLVIELFERRLAGWKKNFLSKGGRYTLIKSTMANLTIYFLSFITIPVKWEDVKKPINFGGLGIRSMVNMNIALQGKWLWRYLTEVNSLWRKIVHARWGMYMDRKEDTSKKFVEKNSDAMGQFPALYNLEIGKRKLVHFLGRRLD